MSHKDHDRIILSLLLAVNRLLTILMHAPCFSLSTCRVWAVPVRRDIVHRVVVWQVRVAWAHRGEEGPTSSIMLTTA